MRWQESKQHTHGEREGGSEGEREGEEGGDKAVDGTEEVAGTSRGLG